MTSLLLDTHAVLWWFNNPSALSDASRSALGDRGNRVLASSISAYEIAYKHRLGKLQQADRLLTDYGDRLTAEGFDQLVLTHDHAIAAGRLDPAHRDPFDRLLMGQALVDDLTLVSNEALFDRYGVRRLW